MEATAYKAYVLDGLTVFGGDFIITFECILKDAKNTIEDIVGEFQDACSCLHGHAPTLDFLGRLQGSDAIIFVMGSSGDVVCSCPVWSCECSERPELMRISLTGARRRGESGARAGGSELGIPGTYALDSVYIPQANNVVCVKESINNTKIAYLVCILLVGRLLP